MNRSEFIDKVFSFFKGASDNQKTAYDIALSTREEIDWDRLYAITVREGETYLPKPKWFIERFYRCKKGGAENYYENEGKIVEVALKSGHTYEFELYKCSKSKAEIIDGLKRKFTDSEGISNVISIDFYEDRYEQLKAHQQR